MSCRECRGYEKKRCFVFLAFVLLLVCVCTTGTVCAEADSAGDDEGGVIERPFDKEGIGAGTSIDKIRKGHDVVLEKLKSLGPMEVEEPLPLNSEGDVVPDKMERRDPFALTRELVKKTMDTNFMPQRSDAEAKVELPALRMRGLLMYGGGERIGLLAVGNEVHLVRVGDTVGLHEQGMASALKILEINSHNIVVEFGSMEQLIIVQ